MKNRFSSIAFTDAVKEIQRALGSRKAFERVESGPEAHGELGTSEAEFVGERDSFYMASVGETGWPYIQHRGGPAGFVRVLDSKTLGFADFAGNRQYITLGNVAKDDRVALFFMDYRNQARLKLLGHTTIVPADDEKTMARLTVPGYDARVERGILVRVEAFDWNCRQHITQRFTLAEIEDAVAPLQQKIRELETALRRAEPGRDTAIP